MYVFFSSFFFGLKVELAACVTGDFDANSPWQWTQWLSGSVTDSLRQSLTPLGLISCPGRSYTSSLRGSRDPIGCDGGRRRFVVWEREERERGGEREGERDGQREKEREGERVCTVTMRPIWKYTNISFEWVKLINDFTISQCFKLYIYNILFKSILLPLVGNSTKRWNRMRPKLPVQNQQIHICVMSFEH